MRRLFAATALLALVTTQPTSRVEANDFDDHLERIERLGASLLPIEEELALAVAQVWVNEASLSGAPPDGALIWQTIESRRPERDGETRAQLAARRLRWLTSHSSCVLDSTQAEAMRRPGNCRWSRNLNNSDERPAHLQGPWDPQLWENKRLFARGLVAGVITWRPCDGDPFTWDGRRWRGKVLDRVRRGETRLRLLRCQGTVNDGWGLPSP